MRGVLPQSVLDDIERGGYCRGWDALYSPHELEVRDLNRARYSRQRGRVCEYPGCEDKIRCTRVVPVCRKHEDTEFAECHPATEPGSTIRPRLFGLKAARKKRGLTAQELADFCGRSLKWAQQAGRPRNGVDAPLRRYLAELLNVSEAELLEGSE